MRWKPSKDEIEEWMEGKEDEFTQEETKGLSTLLQSWKDRSLQHEIDLDSSKEGGFCFLGMRAKNVEFRSPKTFPTLCDSCTAFSKSSFTRS